MFDFYIIGFHSAWCNVLIEPLSNTYEHWISNKKKGFSKRIQNTHPSGENILLIDMRGGILK